MNKWAPIHLDEKGIPFLIDQEELHLASAKFNKTRSPVGGVTRQTRSGNPWFDPNTGRFANGPPGVSVRAGGALLRNLLNTSKRYISSIAGRVKADGIMARPGDNGRVIIVLYKGGQELVTFDVPSKDTDPSEVETARGAANQGSGIMAPNNIPEGVDPEEWERRMDAVRRAAREFEPHEMEDIREWLEGKTNRDLTEQELESFLSDVRRQRVSDLVDVLDTSIRRRVALRQRGRRTVRVVPPKGWVRRTLANLKDEEIVELHRRLRSRGFSQEELESHLINRYDEKRRAKLQARVGKVIKRGKPIQPKK